MIRFIEKPSIIEAAGNKPKRIALFQQYFNNPLCDLGDTSGKSPDPDAWKTGKLTLEQQLRYKFILAIEGNDVASNPNG